MKVLLQATPIVLFTFLSSQNASAAIFSSTGIKVARNIIHLSQSNHNDDDAPFQFIDEHENENPPISSSSSTNILHQPISDERHRGKAHLSPSFVHSIKNKMGIVSSFDNSLPAESETGVLVDTHLITDTTPVHKDHYPADKDGKRSPVREDREVAFVFLNSNPDAYFQHGDMSVPVVEGSLVYFNGRVAHNTVVNSGVVHLLGPFEVGPLMGSAGIIGGIGTGAEPSLSPSPSISKNPSSLPTISTIPSSSSVPTGICGSTEDLMEIIVELDSKANETSWLIYDACTLEHFQSMKYNASDSNSTKTHTYCADKNTRYDLVLLDSGGDGIELMENRFLSVKFGLFDKNFTKFSVTEYGLPLKILSCTVECNKCSSEPSLSPSPSTSMNPSSVPTITTNPSFAPTVYPTKNFGTSLSISFVWTCLFLVVSCLMVTF